MRYFTQALTLMGHVEDIDAGQRRFVVRCRSGDRFDIHVGATTNYQLLKNLDNLDRDRIPRTAEGAPANDDAAQRLWRYIREGELIVVHGVHQIHDGKRRFDAKSVHLMHYQKGAYLFEETHWWLKQISRMADEWLEDVFQDRRSYRVDDFAQFYRTNLNIYGQPSDDTIQECATLSRLVYGLSSAYLLTGAERFFLAARAGVEYLRQTFRRYSHDGHYCFWSHARRKTHDGSEMIEPSLGGDDLNTIPLYEQIYALAGLAQFYRITLDPAILDDIGKTIRVFEDFYHDDDRPRSGGPFPGLGGYFSHLDYATMRPDSESLLTGSWDNRLKKNWNSIGDHVPAYLVNLMLAIDPLPQGRSMEGVSELRVTCWKMLKETSELICDKFVDPDRSVPFVNERFYADWTVDDTWSWQQDRGIVGHNLKISWNLTRCANRFSAEAQRLEDEDPGGSQAEIAELRARAEQCTSTAVTLADRMAEVGLDQIRGGVFDAMEREPKNGMPMEFAWMNTKDFWQQEQGILAYLILHGHMQNCPDYSETNRFLALARETSAFWNLFFLDRDRRGVHFRVSDDGQPVVEGGYANKAGHAIAGYHAFELSYLAHIYTRSFVGPESQTDDSFCLYFRPAENCDQRSVNVLPDFVRQGDVRISAISVNGIPRSTGSFDPEHFQVQLADDELGMPVMVEFCVCKNARDRTDAPAPSSPASCDATPEHKRCAGL
jgi:mannose/cellobiose epimerase-like protein (N-acyl-D-glucosamine 2-epimerase family)